jgi:LytS/YehU family sensor histidine kinase
MELEKLQTELAYLKSQINPHFLFNSLNTIFFQIDKENAVARDTLTKFSDMLRYQLYECNGHEISLDREVGYLRNYVDLQRLRKDERYQITIDVSGNPHGHTVAPLLFIPLVENAFKHLSHYPQGGNRVHVSLRIDGEIDLTITNTRDNRPRPMQPGGIGLKNLQRRLELQYPGRHELHIRESATDFEAQLIIRK